MKIVIIAVLFILIITTFSGCLSQTQMEKPISQDKTAIETSEREASEAGVMITAVYLGNNSFEISVDTHSGSLDYDMKEVSYVRESGGNIIKPTKWEGGFGGHHVKGMLTFPKFNDTAGFELVIQDFAGVKERVLKW